jgi:elongator complex protein 2
VDKTIRVWQKSQTDSSVWRTILVLEGHTSSINCIGVLSSQNLFVTGAADASLKVWQLSLTETEPSEWNATPLHSIPLTPKFFPLALAIESLSVPSSSSSNELVLAVAGTKASIQVYVAKGVEANGNPFSLVATLAGHEGWVRSLAVTYETTDDASSDLIIASASQDKYIRLWRIHRGQALPTSSRALNDPTLGILAKSSLSNKAHRFSTASQQFSITFEALLLGHEDWIYTASWHRYNSRLQLLSASADNSLAVWEADEATGIWMCIARLGEISAQKVQRRQQVVPVDSG